MLNAGSYSCLDKFLTEELAVPAGEKCPRCGSVMKQSPGTQPGAEIWICVRCRI